MENLIKTISKIGVIPVIVIEDANDAVPLARALLEGGLPAAEVTFRTAAAAEAIQRIAAAFPEMTVAAGTVLTPEQADLAMRSGAKFLVSPGLSPKTVAHCKEKGYPIIPGVVTPSEVELALSFGLQYLKFFPAEAAGGAKMIRAMSAPYTGVRFMPTGGIGVSNLREYFDVKSVYACGGSWMVPAKLLKEKNFDEIRRLTAEAAALVKEIRG